MPVGIQKVLIVDDDPAMLRLLAKWLETAGYQTQRAGDGRQAIAAIETDCPHIVITDWEMPHLDGLELCRWLRTQQLPHYVYAIFLTVRSGLADIIKGLDAGADDFLKKPIDRGELLARLKSGERLVELEQRLSAMAFSDSLTGLATQRVFYEHLKREWQRSQRFSLPLSCVMIDVDFFKRINDAYGHPVGDEVIRRVADILRENTRGGDIVSRYGGEEFCVALPETDEHQAVQWAERVREIISRNTFPVTNKDKDKDIRITASFGVVQRLEDIKAPESLVDLADQALLVAKRSGRDRVVTYRSLVDGELGANLQRSLAETLDKVPARAAMTTVVAGLNHNKSVEHAARYFLRFRISSAPIVDDNGKLVGILSERDLISATPMREWWATPIREVMKQNVVCYDEDTPVSIIYDFLGRVSLRSVVIVKDGSPIGMMSRSSLLRWFMNNLEIGRPISNDPLMGDSSNEGDQRQQGVSRPREQLAALSSALAKEVNTLETQLHTSDEELLSYLVGGASRIQELVNDLLACSRYIHLNHDNNEVDGAPFVRVGVQDITALPGTFENVANPQIN